MRYVICVNRPGYLPEMEPYTVDGIDEAAEAVQVEVDRTAEAHDLRADPEVKAKIAGDLRKLGCYSAGVMLGGYVHEAVPEGC